ncbi:MAG: peptidoglycan-associated lipoprotein Pal [Rhodocyclaceae bacterium]|nr:peptidoglycan-associated lipoprotein Pal [Rhodocyclaceae bacterium]
MNRFSRKTLIRSLLPALAVSLLAACSSTPESSDLATVDATGTSGVPKLSAAAMAKLRDPNSPLSKRSVYFDYDQYDVKGEYKNQLQAHAKFIASEPNARVLVQGNTDDRGSREYNLALGQRRADAIKKQLVLMGAPESQIESVSLGKEKPKALGDNEAAWAENRRGDMLYNGEY